MNWLSRQVIPTLKLAMKIDKLNQTSVIQNMIDYAELSDRQKKILQQQTLPVEEVIIN